MQECQSDRSIAPSTQFQAAHPPPPPAPSGVPYGTYNVHHPPHHQSFNSPHTLSASNTVPPNAIHPSYPSPQYSSDSSLHQSAHSPYYNGPHQMHPAPPHVSSPVNAPSPHSAPFSPPAYYQPVPTPSSPQPVNYYENYYDNNYYPSAGNSTVHNAPPSPPLHYNSYHSIAPANVASFVQNGGVVDTHAHVPTSHSSNYTQIAAHNSQYNVKTATYQDDPSITVASHYSSQINSPSSSVAASSSSSPSATSSSSPSHYPVQYNYHQQQMSPPSAQVAHHYSDQLPLHRPHIISPNAPVNTLNSNINNGNFNHYYPQAYTNLPQYSSPHVNVPQQQKYSVNYIHPIAPSVANDASINRKFDSGSPYPMPSPAHSFVNVSRAQTPFNTVKSTVTSTTTPKPIELEMSLEDIFRLAQISSMFSNMSFMSMDSIASASDAKVSVNPNDGPKMIAPIKLPMAGEDGKTDDGREYLSTCIAGFRTCLYLSVCYCDPLSLPLSHTHKM